MRAFRPLKLYYWATVHALAEYSPGTAFAMAESLDQAIDLISGPPHPPGTEADIIEFWMELRAELRRSPPQIYHDPIGFALQGSS